MQICQDEASGLPWDGGCSSELCEHKSSVSCIRNSPIINLSKITSELEIQLGVYVLMRSNNFSCIMIQEEDSLYDHAYKHTSIAVQVQNYSNACMNTCIHTYAYSFRSVYIMMVAFIQDRELPPNLLSFFSIQETEDKKLNFSFRFHHLLLDFFFPFPQNPKNSTKRERKK